jgi:PEGA domain
MIAMTSLLLCVSAEAQTCSKVVSFALADASGVHPYALTGNWIGNWVQKNAKKHPDICFSQTPVQDRSNYLIVLSQSSGYLTGFDPVVRRDTSTSTTPVSGSGTVRDNYGGMWNYTYNGTVTSTTTTTTNENVPYMINSRTIYAYAYADGGVIVSQHYHVYSTKTGGDTANSAGYNIGNALLAINARGRLLNSAVKDIEAHKNYENHPLELAKVRQASYQASASPHVLPNSMSQPQPAVDAAINIVSTPTGADVELDGSFVGNTPSNIGVSPGDHTITVTKAGYELWKRTIKISSGKVNISAELEAKVNPVSASGAATVALAPKESKQKTEATAQEHLVTPIAPVPTASAPTPENVGTVTLASSPSGAEIYLNSSFVGKTPLTLKLVVGQYFFHIFADGCKNWSQEVTIAPGAEIRLTATLEKSN